LLVEEVGVVQRDLARLLVKVAALFIIVSAFSELPVSFARWLASSNRSIGMDLVGMTLAPVSISILAGLAMFLWAGPIVDRTLVSGPKAHEAGPFDLRGFEEIALTVLGLYLLAVGFSELVYDWARWSLYDHLIAGLRTPTILPQEFAGLLAGATHVLVGTILVLCSRGVITLKRRLLALRPMSQTEG
jgi:hypothetical protein